MEIGKWEVGSGKWKVESGKWKVGIPTAKKRAGRPY